jgi:hypothetical protein
VVGSAVNARLGTWQVPQACWPEADKLVSKKSAFPATAAADGEAGVEEDAPELASPPPPPPHPDRAAAINPYRTHLARFFETIRLHPAQVLNAPRLRLRLRMLSRIIRICNCELQCGRRPARSRATSSPGRVRGPARGRAPAPAGYGRSCTLPKVPGAPATCNRTPGLLVMMPLTSGCETPAGTTISTKPSPLTSATATSLACVTA